MPVVGETRGEPSEGGFVEQMQGMVREAKQRIADNAVEERDRLSRKWSGDTHADKTARFLLDLDEQVINHTIALPEDGSVHPWVLSLMRELIDINHSLIKALDQMDREYILRTSNPEQG